MHSLHAGTHRHAIREADRLRHRRRSQRSCHARVAKGRIPPRPATAQRRREERVARRAADLPRSPPRSPPISPCRRASQRARAWLLCERAEPARARRWPCFGSIERKSSTGAAPFRIQARTCADLPARGVGVFISSSFCVRPCRRPSRCPTAAATGCRGGRRRPVELAAIRGELTTQLIH